MSQFSYSPYKKAILFEKIEYFNSNKNQVADPFHADLTESTSVRKQYGTGKLLLAIGTVLAVHYGIFYIAHALPTPTLIIQKPEPVVIEIIKPKEEPPKIIEPKLKPAEQKPVIPPISEKPQPVQKQSVEKPAPKAPVQKQIEQAKPVHQAVSKPVQQAEPTENVIPTPAPKAAEPVSKPSQENLPVTTAKGYAGYLSNPAPEYPDIALDRGWEGAVMLRVKVSTTGSPLEINIKTGSGKKALDDAAVRTVKRWKFSPAMRGSTPIEGWVDVPIQFKLPH